MVFAGNRLQPRLRGEGGRKIRCTAPGAAPLSLNAAATSSSNRILTYGLDL